MVVAVGVNGCLVDTRCVAVPVVCNLMIVNYVDPAQILAHGRPVRRRVNLTVLLAVVFDSLAPVARNVDVDEVAEEQHEVGTKRWKHVGEMPHAGNSKRVVKRAVGEATDDARGRQKGEGALAVCLGRVSHARWGDELSRMVVRGPPFICALVRMSQRN